MGKASRFKQCGFGLLEIILALAIASVLSVSVVFVYAFMSRLIEKEHAVLHIENEAMTVISQLNRSIHLSGLDDCSSEYSFVKQGDNAHCFTAEKLPGYFKIKALTGSDVLLLTACVMKNHHQKFQKIAYFVALSKRYDMRHRLIPVFYEKPIAGRRVELAEYMSEFNVNLNEDAVDYQLAFKSPDLKKLKHWFSFAIFRERR